MQARYYDPVIGRFYSNDPIGFRGVHSFNRYAYANNNPYRYVDPDGRDPMERQMARRSKVLMEAAAEGSKRVLGKDSAITQGLETGAKLASKSVSDMKKAMATVINKPSIFAKDKAPKRSGQIFPTKQSVSKSEIGSLRDKFLGDKIVKVAPGKWRNADGTRQFRVKPDDFAGHKGGTPHVHLEFLKPNATGTKFNVTKNVHIPLVD